MVETFIPGEVVHIPFRITTIAGTTADPGGITLLVKPPVGADISYTYGVAPEVVRDAEGLYHANIPVAAVGRWYYRLELSAPSSGAAEGHFTVQQSRFVT